MASYFSWFGAGGSFTSAASWIDDTTSAMTGIVVPGLLDSVDFGSGIVSGTTISGGGAVYALTVEADVTFAATISATAIGNSGTTVLAAGSLTAADSLVNSGTLVDLTGYISALYFTNSGLVLLQGGALNSTGFVGDNGTMSISGEGCLNAAGGIAVGDSSAGTLAITGNGVVTDSAAIVGDQTGSNGTASVNGSAAIWWNTGALTVGQSGTGSVTVANGGVVDAQNLYAAVANGASATATIEGSGSDLAISQSALIGEAGEGTLVAENSALVWIGTVAIAGETAGGNGVLTVSYANVEIGQALLLGEAGSGSLAVSGGGIVSTDNSALGYLAGGSGTAVVSGAGSQLVDWQSTNVGVAGQGVLEVLNGATATSYVSLDVGTSAQGNGSITVSGTRSLLTAAAAFVIGDAGDGTLVIANAATAQTPVLEIGNRAGSSGTLSVSGSGSYVSVNVASIGGNWSAAGGTGLLSVASGGVLTDSGWTTIWNKGTVQLSGGEVVSQAVVVLGSVTGYGTIMATSALAGYEVMNAGSIIANGGTLDVVGSVNQSGTLEASTNSELLLQNSVTASQTIVFAPGTGETLALASPALMEADIFGFGAGDTIELLGMTVSQLLYSNGSLVAIGPGGPDDTLRAVGAFALQGNYSLSDFSFATDAQGNSFITYGSTVAAVTSAVTSISESTYLETHSFFAASSPWNTAIPADDSGTAIAGMNTIVAGLTSWEPTSGSVAIYYAQTSDPLVPVLYNPNTYSMVADGAWLRTGNSAAVEEQILASSSATDPIPANPYSTAVAGLTWNSTPSGLPTDYDQWIQASGQTLYIYAPTGIQPTDSSDGQTVIIQPDGMAIELYSPIVLSTGQIVSSAFSATNALDGTGTGADNGRTASMIENYAGVLRDIDVTSGTIDHALAVVVPQSMIEAAVTGPALAFDSNTSGYAGTLAMGSHLALPSSLSLPSLDLTTTLGMEIAKAAQTYGEYIVDTGGTGISIVTQNDPTSAALNTWSSNLQNDLDTIFSHEVLLPS